MEIFLFVISLSLCICVLLIQKKRERTEGPMAERRRKLMARTPAEKLSLHKELARTPFQRHRARGI